jgi:protein-tyrosine phosphatase
MTQKILMVCLGNICRSPLAEAALRAHGEARGFSIEVDSAGTGDWHIGHLPDKRSIQVAKAIGGIDISGLRARQVKPADFHSFDYILAMDRANLSALKQMQPPDGKAQLSMLLDHLPGHEGRDVADPYYGDIRDFELCWDIVNRATLTFIGTLESGFA